MIHVKYIKMILASFLIATTSIAGNYVDGKEVVDAKSVTTESITLGGETWYSLPEVLEDWTIGNTNQIDATTISGVTLESLVNIGAQYYFSTNTTVVGVVTGRTASLEIPTNSVLITYPGPVTNTQYIGTYVIPEEDMPLRLNKGVYTVKFRGWCDSGPNTNVIVKIEVYAINKTNGLTVVEYESAPIRLNDTEDDFNILISILDDMKSEGNVFVIKTKVVDTHGYIGPLYSKFGDVHYSGFTIPHAEGIYVSYSQMEAFSQLYTLSSVLATQIWSVAQYPLALTDLHYNIVTSGHTGTPNRIWGTDGNGDMYEYYINDSFKSPYELISQPTVTVTRAMNNELRLLMTNNVELTYSEADFPTNGVCRFGLSLYKGNFTLTINTDLIDATSFGNLNISENSWNYIIFNKGYGQDKMEVR